MRRTHRVGLMIVAALGGTGRAAAGDPSSGSFDTLARLVSPEFRRLDDRRAELRHAPAAFRPPPAQCPHLGYHSRFALSAASPRWVQVDLGETRPLDAVVVVPAAGPPGDDGPGYFFPTRFRVELADTPDFTDAVVIADHADADYPSPGDRPVVVPAHGRAARYVRFTATRLAGRGGRYFFALGELLALSGKLNLAAGRPVTASDAIENLPVWGCRNLVDGQGLLGPPLGPERSSTNGYHAEISPVSDAVKWVQVDLGSDRPLDEVRLVPARPSDFPDRGGFGFPVRFKVEAAAGPEFRAPVVLLDSSAADFLSPGDGLVVIPARGVTARHVRITATRLWERTGDFVFALAELQVYSRGVNVAREAAVTAADSIERGLWSRRYLVDGFASQHQLVEWPEWLEQERRAADQDAEMREVDARWAEVRGHADDTLARGAVGVAGVGVVLAAGLVWRSRVARRREADQLRDRIARDLHDEVGSNLGGILLLAQSGAGREPDTARRDLAEIARIARQTADAMRDLVWLLGHGPDTADDLSARMRETAAALLAGVEYTVDIPIDCLPRQPGLEFRRQVFLAFKEMLHNAARHAGAKTVTVRCRRDGAWFVLEVRDDGRGFDPAAATGGTGLRSLRTRAAILKGELVLESAPDKGATAQLRVPTQ
ncbi:MAG: coagulation factor 5/8 type domain protein [Gemmataceae bacterium]|nr:coagulation factor 5/8 type domain protein [Gemmataceae bacterium]